MGFQVGVGRKDITPEIGCYLYGYRPDLASESVHDPLAVTAVAFSDGGRKAVVMSATVCLIDEEIVDEIRQGIAQKSDVSADQIIVAPTHTHSGPRTRGSSGWGAVDREYCDKIFVPRCIEAALEALQSMKCARMGVGTTHSNVGINRRELSRNNRIGLGQCEWGTFDPTMTVITFIDEEKKPIVNMIHYGAHLTAAGADPSISRDWGGVMVDRVEQETGTISVFLNGPEGDVGPRLSNGRTTGDMSHVAEIGSQAALDAMRAYRSIREYHSGSCHTFVGEICIPYEPIMPLEQVREELAQYKQVPDANIMLQKYTILKQIEELHAQGKTGDEDFVINQTLIAVGSIVFVPVQFEHFSQIALRLREHSPFAHTLSLSNGNANYTYLPTEDQICRGGYEIEVFHWFMPRRLPDNADFHIIDGNIKLIDELLSTVNEADQ